VYAHKPPGGPLPVPVPAPPARAHARGWPPGPRHRGWPS